MAAGEDHYYSDSDSDDDDVDRYVFLARQPGQHVEEDASDDEDEETDDEGGGDGRWGKRSLNLIRDAASPSTPNKKKARHGLIIAFPSAAEQKPTTSNGTDQATSSPCGGVRTGSYYPGARAAAAMKRTNTPPAALIIRGKEKLKMKTKRPLVGASGKRSRSGPGCEDEADRDPRRDVLMAAEKTSPSSSATTTTSARRRFQCNRCERCFDSHQALGGHVHGHQRKARIAAIAAAASLDDEIDDAACRKEDGVDRGGHRKANKKNKKRPSIIAEEQYYMDARGDGSKDMRVSVSATSPSSSATTTSASRRFQCNRCERCFDSHQALGGHVHGHQRKARIAAIAAAASLDDADGGRGNRTTEIAVVDRVVDNDVGYDNAKQKTCSRRSFHNGNEETAIGAGGHNDADDVGNKKASRKGGAAPPNGSSNVVVDACSGLHKCKVCGTECLTGRALGGHMRKHYRKLPAQGAGGDDVLTAAEKTSPSSSSTTTSATRRFQCNRCERCFDSHQALGGHVHGHQKKARIAAIAAAASLDDVACRKEDGVDRVGHRKSKKEDKKKPFIIAEEHCMDARGDGASIDDMRASVSATSHEGVREKASSSHSNEADVVRNKKAAAGASRNKGGVAAPNGSSNVVVDACSGLHKCKVCGTECLTGRALGGHMRKHRKKLPAQGAGVGGVPATTDGDDDGVMPKSRQLGAEGLQRALVIAGETSS